VASEPLRGEVDPAIGFGEGGGALHAP
jgi:hypothetical protein